MWWVAEKEFWSEAADFEVSVAEGIKEGGVGRGAESARDVGDEGSVFDACDMRGPVWVVNRWEKCVGYQGGGGEAGRGCEVATHSR